MSNTERPMTKYPSVFDIGCSTLGVRHSEFSFRSKADCPERGKNRHPGTLLSRGPILFAHCSTFERQASQELEWIPARTPR